MRVTAITAAVLVSGCVIDGGESSPPTPEPPVTPNPPTGTALARTLFVNAEGVLVRSAAADDATLDRSTIVDEDTSLRPYLALDPARTSKIATIVGLIETTLASYDVTVTTTRPASGTYNMVVLTDDGGSRIGLVDSVYAIAPITCNSVPSVTSFVFTKGGLEDHHIARAMIENLGLAAGIPHVSKADDCMYGGSNAGPVPDSMCTISGAGTPVADNACGLTATSIDVHQRFLDAFGAP